MRVSEGLQVYFTLAGFVPVDKVALRIPARSVAANVVSNFSFNFAIIYDFIKFA
jgi:hypothetical protein